MASKGRPAVYLFIMADGSNFYFVQYRVGIEIQSSQGRTVFSQCDVLYDRGDLKRMTKGGLTLERQIASIHGKINFPILILLSIPAWLNAKYRFKANP